MTTSTVVRLIEEQFSSWAGLGVCRVQATGTVNAIFRVGPEMSARFLLVPADPADQRRILYAEAAAARELHGQLRVAKTPEPLAVGGPGPGYPGPWSIQTWLPGTTAEPIRAGPAPDLARDLAELIVDLRAIPTRGRTFRGTNRGGHLRAHDAWMTTCIRASEPLLDTVPLRALWATARDLPRGATPDVMSHGDLIPANLLLTDGRLTGVLDTGGFAPADPALDLVAAWHLLDPGDRDLLRAGIGVNDDEWARGQAWAFEQALGLIAYYAATNPAMSALGRSTLHRILTDP